MIRVSAVAVCFAALGLGLAGLEPAWPAPGEVSSAAKGNFASVPDPGPRGRKVDFGSVPDPGPRGQKADFGSVPDPGPRGSFAPPANGPREAVGTPDPTMPAERRAGQPEDVGSDILTIDAARRAVDAFVAVRDNYTDDGIETYGSLERFVAETEAGQRLEAEIMAHGFSDITDWNVTIMAVGSAYSAIIYDYANDLRQQIRDVRNDSTLDEEMRARLIAGLNALMPSRGNRTVLQALLDDPDYRDKLRLLQEEE